MTGSSFAGSALRYNPVSNQEDPLWKTRSDLGRRIREVWAWNFDQEFPALVAAVADAGGSSAVLAIDVEFPGFVRKAPPHTRSSRTAVYTALRENVDMLVPIQLGAAVSSSDGTHYGVWSFNFKFDAAVDRHTEESLDFLRKAGLDFPRHRIEGIAALDFGQRLARSSLVGQHGPPCWLTFSGLYDLGYLLKLLTSGRPMPAYMGAFEQALGIFCPQRRELRDQLDSGGSLEDCARRHGVQRHGRPHTAGSDALLTLELYIKLRDKVFPVLKEPRPEHKNWTPWPQDNFQDTWTNQSDWFGEESWDSQWNWTAPQMSDNFSSEAWYPSGVSLVPSLSEATATTFWNLTMQAEQARQTRAFQSYMTMDAMQASFGGQPIYSR